MKNGLIIIFSLLSFTATYAQSQQVLNVNDFEKKLSTTKEKTILDVRTAEEYSQGHLANAVNIDYYQTDFKQSISKLDKNKPVFVYCLAGGRSSSASDVMKELGFKQIYNMQGGVKAWSAARKELVK